MNFDFFCVHVCVCVSSINTYIAAAQMMGDKGAVLSSLGSRAPLASGHVGRKGDAEDPVTIALRKEGILPPSSAPGDRTYIMYVYCRVLRAV
jgi:hypothetical protein